MKHYENIYIKTGNHNTRLNITFFQVNKCRFVKINTPICLLSYLDVTRKALPALKSHETRDQGGDPLCRMKREETVDAENTAGWDVLWGGKNNTNWVTVIVLHEAIKQEGHQSPQITTQHHITTIQSCTYTQHHTHTLEAFLQPKITLHAHMRHHISPHTTHTLSKVTSNLQHPRVAITIHHHTNC